MNDYVLNNRQPTPDAEIEYVISLEVFTVLFYILRDYTDGRITQLERLAIPGMSLSEVARAFLTLTDRGILNEHNGSVFVNMGFIVDTVEHTLDCSSIAVFLGNDPPKMLYLFNNEFNRFSTPQQYIDVNEAATFLLTKV